MAGAYSKMSDDKKMQAEMDLHTLIEAGKIRKSPDRMKAVQQCKKEKMAAMEAVDAKKES